MRVAKVLKKNKCEANFHKSHFSEVTFRVTKIN